MHALRLYHCLLVICVFSFLSFTFAQSPTPSPTPTPTCTKVIDIARSTYFTQIEYMRRGLDRLAAYTMYVKFIEQLSTLASAQAQTEFSFGNYCLPNKELEELADIATNTLHTTLKLEEYIKVTNASVPILTRESWPALPEDRTVAMTEWILTELYLMESMEKFVNATRIHFPNEMDVVYDPYTDDACTSYNSSFTNLNITTRTAENMTISMLSMVSVLINMGANATKALQLMQHNTALCYVGTRCLKKNEHELQIPLTYMQVYGRQAARLSQNNSLVAKPGIDPNFISLHGERLTHLLSGYQSGGQLPPYFISSYGTLIGVQSDWKAVSDELQTMQLAEASLSKPLILTDGASTSGESSLDLFVRWAKKHLMGSSDYKRQAKHTVRNSGPCNGTWEYIDSVPYNVSVLEQCCAELCKSGADVLQEPAATDFRTGCCFRCNQIHCPLDETGDDLVDLITFNITFPPYGNAPNGSTPVMI